MDKKTLLGIILVTLIMFVWMFYTSSNKTPVPDEQVQDTLSQTVNNLPDSKKQDVQDPSDNIEPVNYADKYGKYFSDFATGEEQYTTVETEYYKAIISNKGGTIVRWTLKNYNKWNGSPVQLINYKNHELYIRFVTTDAKRVDTRNLYFTSNTNNSNGKIQLKNNESKELVYSLDLGDGRLISKKITFYADKYHILQDITTSSLDNILKSGYSLMWDGSLNYQEYNSVAETDGSAAIVAMNGQVEQIDASKSSDREEKNYTGIIDYVAIKTKYFTAAIIPQPWQQFDASATIVANHTNIKKDGKVATCEMSINVPYKGGKQTNSFQIFIGPIDYNLVQKYGIESTVDMGWRYLIRPIGEYLILPMINLVHKFVPNYGVAIIIFSIIMKILLYPLSIQQMRSASKMKLLAPEMEKIREKYKSDMQKQQAETMKLYSEYGLNPAGGCLPMLVQFPILIALWRVLNSTIDLRQQGFALWITDLSRPDILINWGFSILGLKHLSGLALAMAVAMFIQQKMTITDPRQKSMVYMMPLMFLFMFSNFPSGLNLYYFMFNLLSIFQQIYINKFSKNKLTLADLKKQPKKEGWMQKKMREAQELAASQGRQMPSMYKKVENNNKYQNNSNKRKK